MSTPRYFCCQQSCMAQAMRTYNESTSEETISNLCVSCSGYYRANRNGACPICGVQYQDFNVLAEQYTGTAPDCVLSYVTDTPFELIRCNHWACERCWDERFNQGIYQCFTCTSNVGALMAPRYHHLIHATLELITREDSEVPGCKSK